MKGRERRRGNRARTGVDLVPPTKQNGGAHEAPEYSARKSRGEHADAENQQGLDVASTQRLGHSSVRVAFVNWVLKRVVNTVSGEDSEAEGEEAGNKAG